MIQTKPKDKSLSTLIHEADDVFSKYIRLRDANKQHPFYLNCFTCGKAERIEWAPTSVMEDLRFVIEYSDGTTTPEL